MKLAPLVPAPLVLATLTGLFTPSLVRAQSWPTVPPADFSALTLAQFADHELEVPYHLRHFAQVANAVVETGPDRGFLALRVNREPVDNQPHNARIMENQLALAYFYTANRPWNPYRGSAAVRVRLEAMLDRWARIQNQPGPADGDFDGLWAEYSATNWSLAPTSFGVMHAAEAIDLVRDSQLPFDAAVLEQARVALRRGLLAIFTRADLRQHAREWSNQFSGAYHAALLYLENWADPELDAAFTRAIEDAAAQDQSPAGYFYEQGGPDFGYSAVHENNLRVALPRLRARPIQLGAIAEEDIAWNEWLAAMAVLQPGSSPRLFLLPAGLNTRTSHAFQTPRSRPLAEWAEPSRSFALTDEEYNAAVAARRAEVQAEFGRWGALSVPSAYSYIPNFVFDAVRPLNTWHPTAAQRAAADATWPSRFDGARTRQFHDPRPFTVTALKRPGYYAVAATGRIRVTRQAYGLGLLWHPRFGVALQTVAEPLATANWTYGTRRAGVAGGATYETADLTATFTVGGAAHTPAPGARPLGDGDVMVSYPLENGGTRYGRKTLTFSAQQIDVAVEHSGGFTELLPLAHASDAALTLTASRVELRRPDGAVFTVEVNSAGATLAVGSTSTLTTGLVRRLVTITGTGALAYQLTFAASSSGGSGGGSNPPTPPAVVPSPSPGGGGGGGAPTWMGTLLLAALLALRSRRRQRAGAPATSSTAW